MFSETDDKTISGAEVLVTGGAGFIGSHLCKRLLDEGYRVTCIDDLFSGSEGNVRRLVDQEGFTFLNADVSCSNWLDRIANPSLIFNLACPASPVFYQSDPIGTMKTSVMGALNVLELARRCGARILQTSTSEVYGDPLEHPQAETYRGNVSITGPRACYDEGKRAAETLFYDYSREHGTDIRVVRIFNTYGPHMRPDDGRVVSSFIWQALHGEDITVFGSGEQTRSFCYVDDLVEGLMRMMGQEEITGPVNLGNPCETTVMQLAETIIELTDSDSRIVCKELPTDDPRRRKPDISLAKKALDWEPRTPLARGLNETIAFFKEIM